MIPSVLCIVPAKDSIRIPRKNVRLLAGVSPVVRSLAVARGACPTATLVLTSVYGNADDAGPLSAVWNHRMMVQRPASSMVGVVLDVFQAFPGPADQLVLLIQPTQPLRRVVHLHRVLSAFRLGAQSVATVTATASIDKLYALTDQGMLTPLGRGVERDQDGQPTYRCDGTAYGFLRGWFLEHQTFRDPEATWPIVISASESCPLDTPQDWRMAELVIQRWGEDEEGPRGILPLDGPRDIPRIPTSNGP